MRKFLVMTVFSVVFLMPLPKVLACGGGGDYYQPSIEDFAKYDVIVAAKIMVEDDLELNEILQVDRYYKGEGGEYLPVTFYPPALQAAAHLRRYDTGCLYAARWGISQVNKYGYHALSPNSDGTYIRQLSYYVLDGSVEFYSEDKGDDGGDIKLRANEFEQLLLYLVGESDTTEPANSRYPLMRFLNITTESGERYRLNPDRSLTWLDPAEYPIAISNDGSHVMFRLNESELGFQYLATSKKPYAPWANKEGGPEPAGRFTFNGWLHPKPGLDGVFSPNSNFVAMREPTRIVLYLFRSENADGAIVGFGHRPWVAEVASHNLTWSYTEAPEPLAWSADSKALAYQDDQGIWLWRFLEESEPQLVAPTDEVHEFLELSLSGRYLRFGEKGTWTLIDILKGDAWKNSLITPDESRLIHFLSERSVDFQEQHAQRMLACGVSRLLCPMVLIQSGHTGVGSEDLPQDFIWQEPDFLGMVYRDAIQSIRWSFSLAPTHCHLVSCRGVRGLPPIDAAAYDPTYEQPAFAFDETNIAFVLHEYDGFVDSIDLSETLDSPIVDLEWGQPIFYEGR